MKFSIVVPAYNAEKYIERCVASLADQDIPSAEYEVIVVNDGSTDGTETLLRELCGRYDFLRYVTTPNQGLSGARNRGVLETVGEYLLFVDSDDTIRPGCLKGIYREMESGRLDMMLMGYCYVHSDGTTEKAAYHMERNDEKVVSGREFLAGYRFPPMAWAYVYRREFFTGNNFAFARIYHEDEEFTPRAIYLAERMKYYPVVVYDYYQNEGSFMNSYKEQNYYYMIQAMASLNRFKNDCVKERRVKRYLDSHIADRLMMIYKRSIRDGRPIQHQLLERMRAEELYPLRARSASFYMRLFNASPSLFDKFYRFVKRK